MTRSPEPSACPAGADSGGHLVGALRRPAEFGHTGLADVVAGLKRPKTRDVVARPIEDQTIDRLLAIGRPTPPRLRAVRPFQFGLIA